MIYFFSRKLRLNNLGTSENNRLSAYDVLCITKIYTKDPNDDQKIFIYKHMNQTNTLNFLCGEKCLSK